MTEGAAKHARAGRMWLAIPREDGVRTVDVRDDGVGGASLDAGSEASRLSGLRDRIEALEGSYEIGSPAGPGTRPVATFHLASEEQTG